MPCNHEELIDKNYKGNFIKTLFVIALCDNKHQDFTCMVLVNGKWTLARQLGGEIPHYMFPELEEGCCQKFIGMIGDLENNLPKALELINANDIKK